MYFGTDHYRVCSNFQYVHFYVSTSNILIAWFPYSVISNSDSNSNSDLFFKVSYNNIYIHTFLKLKIILISSHRLAYKTLLSKTL